MHIESSILVVAGSLALTVTLGLAWCLAGIRYLSSGFLKKLFPSYQYLLKAHIDFLLMTGLLMVFFLLFAHFQLSPAPLVLVAMCIGSLGNPAGFLALAIKPESGALIAVPTRGGKRGNPVVWSRRFFGELAKLEGDTGARHLIGRYQEAVIEVPADDDAIFLDIDTHEALNAAREIKTVRKA